MPNLPASKTTSGEFSISRMPRGADGDVLTGTGVGSDPAYEAAPGVNIVETSVYDAAAPTSWGDLDLSGVVGSNSAIVMLRIKNEHATAESTYRARENGKTEDVAYLSTYFGGCTTAYIEGKHVAIFLVKTDSSGKIEWYSEWNRPTQIWVIAYWK